MGKGSQTTTNQTSSSPDSNAYADYQQLLQRAQGVASTPYQGYGGELVAPVNQQQNAGISNINANANFASPYIQQAGVAASNAMQPLTQAGIQQYMSPYTQNVVNTTQSQFNDANAQQLQGVKGNAIAQGALGGNREGIAEAETAKSQQLAQAPVIAGLYNTGYNNAVNTAVGQQGIGLQGASTLGNLGVAGQNAALTGANAQIGAGTLQQNTQQNQDAALLAQYQQAQAYPYQQAQWLAGLDTGVGSQMGGTTSGSTTAPAPNQLSTILGGVSSGVGALGATGAFGSAGWMAPLMMSDRRVKENVLKIGKLNDGQIIYRFNYKGDPTTHVGLIAQEVEKKHPDSVHDIAGVKHVDYKSATSDAVERASGGVVGYDSGGGVAPMPWAGAPSWIPTANIAHGSGAPHASAPGVASQGGQDLNKQAASIGGLANTLRSSLNGQTPAALPEGSGIPDAIGPTSVGGAGGPQPLQDAYAGTASNPLPGLTSADYSYARGGVAGFADGGSPDSDNTVVNPDEPYRMPDAQAVRDWRNSADATKPEDTASSDLPVSRGVAPPAQPDSAAMAYAGPDKSKADLPSVITAGDQGSSGVAAPAQTQPSGGGLNWGADSKLWPSLISAGFGMMASRSPFLGVAIGEGGQAGVSSYNEQVKRDDEAKKLQQQMDLEKQRMNLPYQSMTRDQKARLELTRTQQDRENKVAPLIVGSDGKVTVNPAYVKLKEETEKSYKPTWGQIDELPSGRKIMGWTDPNTKQVFDSQGKPYVPTSSAFSGAKPVSTTQPPPTQSSATPPPTSSDSGSGSPPDATQPDQPAGETLHEADPKAPIGSSAARNTSYLAQIADQEPALAAAVKKAADYELDPSKYASMRNDQRQRFIDAVLQYDPNWNPQDVGLRYRAQAAFLPGTKTGDTVRSFNTAVSHLDTLKQLYKAVENGDTKLLNNIKNSFKSQFGYEAPNTLNGIAQIVGGEVVKATVGSQNALGDREELRKTLDRDLSNGQAMDIIDKFQSLMGGQLHSLKFAYEQGTGLHNFEEKFLLPRSREVLKHIDAEGTGTGTSTTPAQTTPQGAIGTRKDTSGKNWYVDKAGKALGPAQ